MNFFIVLSLMFVSSLTLARKTDGKINYKITNGKIELTPGPDFHLNAEGPASAVFDDLKTSYKPDPKTEKLFIFTATPRAKKAKLKFYVCDDKKTVCEQHDKEILLSGGTEESFEKVKAKEKAESNKPAPMNLKSDKHTLLVFSAPWCPACIRMETETYPLKIVQAQFKKLNVNKINKDLPENHELSEKFHVKAIPTLILLNPQGEEIHRWLDYQPAKKFVNEIKSNVKNAVSISQLEKKANKGDAKAISQRGMLAYLAYNCEDAIKWWSKAKNKNSLNHLLAAEVQCAEDKRSEEQIKIFEKGILQTTSKIDRLRWSTDLLSKKKEMKTKANIDVKNKANIEANIEANTATNAPDDLTTAANKALAELNAITKNTFQLKKLFAESTFGDPAGFEAEEILLLKSRLYDVLDNSSGKLKTLEAIKTSADKRNISVDRPGEMLLAIAYLRETDEKVRVQEMYQQLLNKYPTTYVYHEKYARYQLKNKNFEQALISINSALQYPEGNIPQLHLLKARILNEMKDSKQALMVIDETLRLENISHQKYKKTLAAVETLKKEIEAAK